ncbi:predicted protein [Histoplasma mississippiense (nom. inval.)]|uniref:predicted protein n=1 Tax=Ajellomyces capsulatus (strain NAm1 / WU24) TaxID=2059318 RepID=UPI000157C94E|nr:predicted protein [Histoplasma mississippiense (nom. inval.)]EDN09669.1 predicted protein [Histoplasma mississippiense (nom. inval.)]
MAYGQSTEDNCRELLRMHRACEEWAARHGAVFALQKYELMHFTRARNQFNLQAELRLPGQTIQPKQVMRVLGVCGRGIQKNPNKHTGSGNPHSTLRHPPGWASGKGGQQDEGLRNGATN